MIRNVKNGENTVADIIFDVDGTLMNIEHRRHHVMNKPKNWKAFNDETVNDTPHHDIVEMAIMLKNAGNRIIISSGRVQSQLDITIKQLHDAGVMFDAIYLRALKDNRADNLVKSDMLDQMRLDGFDPKTAFDDRQQVVDMWRERGLRCFQVAPGGF
jgi:HAD superfamily, subfamily IIIB (Acid phosphatase)